MRDHLTDTDGEQTVAQIIAGTGLNRNACEQAIHRAVHAEQIERTAPGTYKLAPPKPPSPPKPEPPPSLLDGLSFEEWMGHMEAWDANPASWDRESLGPWPGEPGNRVPWKINKAFARRLEKRRAQAAADAELRDKLIAACGNLTPGPGLDDVVPIKLALEIVPLDCILSAIRGKTDSKLYPKNEPATSWREPRLLKAIAETYCRSLLIPGMVQTGGAAGTAPQKAAGASKASPAVQVTPGAGKRTGAFPRARERPFRRQCSGARPGRCQDAR